MYKLLPSAKDTDGLFIGFDRNHFRQELPNNKNRNRKSHVRFMPRDVFAFAEHLQKTT